MIRSVLLAGLTLSLGAMAAAPAAAPAAGKRITLLFTGDNGAQVAPCG